MKNNNSLPLWPAIVHGRCPRCRRGPMFQNSMYGFHGQNMFKTCSHCGLTYEVEPGYFYVAMLLSYAMNVAELVTGALAVSILTGSENPWHYVIFLLSMSLLLSPFNFRYSRIVLLHLLTPGLNYRPELSADHPETSVMP